MKKLVFPFLTGLLVLILAACGASASSRTNSSQSNSNSNPGNGQGNNFANRPVSVQEQILIGTFKLEKTSMAISSKQAADLLPLWQTYKDLSTNSTTAQQEIDALVSHIQDTMTPDQMKAITDMKLTGRDVFTTMQDLGLTVGRPNSSGTPQPNGQNRNFQGGGGFPGGGGGPGGPGGFNGGGGNGQNLSPQQLATLQARRAQNGDRFNRVPPPLIDALIKLLQEKAAS